MVNKSKKREVNEKIKPNIINGVDLMFSFCLSWLFEEEKLISFFFKIRLEKGLTTRKFKYILITLNFWTNFYGNQQYFDSLLQE